MQKTEIANLIRELIEKTTLSVKDITTSDNEKDGKDKTTWFQVEVDHPHFFINRDGEALLALNHIVRRIVESKILLDKDGEENSEDVNILVDINGFQKKRVDNIKAVAHMMAERARYFKSNIEIDPMSAFERRIVHEFLSDAIDLKTESEGAGPTRRVVIKYIGSI